MIALLAGAFFACRSAPEAERTEKTADLDRLRALPYVDYAESEADEPDGVVVHESDRADDGYSLVTTRPLRRADLIDNSGKVVRSWQAADESGVWEHAELLENGDLFVVGVDEDARPWPDESRYLMKFDWDGTVLWRKRLKAHHDVELTPDGKLSLLVFERRQIPEIDRDVETRDDGIVLLDPASGDVLEQVYFYELFTKGSLRFPFQEVKKSPAHQKPWIDLFHSNSVHWIRHEGSADHDLYRPGNALVTMRNQDAIAIFDWSEQKLLWSWGQGTLSGPHHAQVLTNGNILVFDNGIERRWSRVVEMDPATKEVVWEYSAPDEFYTQDRGSAQRLPNGNTLIGDSNSGVAFEVTPDGRTVWRYVNPLKDPEGRRATIVRAIRHEKEKIETLLAQRGGSSDDSPAG